MYYQIFLQLVAYISKTLCVIQMIEMHLGESLWRNVLDCDIVVSKFKLQSPYYIHFWTNTIEKDMNPFTPPPHTLQVMALALNNP